MSCGSNSLNIIMIDIMWFMFRLNMLIRIKFIVCFDLFMKISLYLQVVVFYLMLFLNF